MTSPKTIGATPLAKPAGNIGESLFQERHEVIRQQYLLKQHDKDYAQNRPEVRAQPADNDHADIENRFGKAELLGVQRAGVVGQQRTGDAGEEAADEEGQQLVIKQVDAHHLGGQVVIADGDKGPAHLGPGEVLGEEIRTGRQ